jgi:hypothetical protein
LSRVQTNAIHFVSHVRQFSVATFAGPTAGMRDAIHRAAFILSTCKTFYIQNHIYVSQYYKYNILM